jgi:alkanesulfonate monooxygenase SsuD/methylene tetrahydromethanopterin reductase-like flavin-dependent oxidoreductase (luciferase family)
MLFGLYLPNQAAFADPRVLASLARDAELAGWDGVFIWDELLSIYDHAVSRQEVTSDRDVDWGAVADPIVALTAMAAATERIRFGALVTPVARLRPETFAQQTATLDRFSGGRLIVGVGLGNPDTQFVAFGHEGDAHTRAARVDEFLLLLVKLWAGHAVDFDGNYFQARDVTLTPTPLQAPRIPIWIGADSGKRAPRRRAARWDGFAPASPEWPHGVVSAAEYRTIVGDIRAERTSQAPFDVVVIGNADATVPLTSDLDEYSEAGVTWHLVQAVTLHDATDRIRRGPPNPSH